MQYKCQECNDTGGRDKIGAYFDCNACDTATTRRDLNDFVKSLTQRSTYPTHPEDVALAIHQRALAMAPKQEAPVVQAPYAWVNAGTERQQTEYATLSVGPENPWMDSANSFPVYAAPTVANSALTDARIMRIACDMKHRNANVWPGDVAYARAILAAAGPDASLTDAKLLVDITTAVMSQHGLIDHLSEGATQAFCDDLRAALSGAKGN